MEEVSEQGIRDANPQYEFGPSIPYQKGVSYMVFTDPGDGTKRRIVFSKMGHAICLEPPQRGVMGAILCNLRGLEKAGRKTA